MALSRYFADTHHASPQESFDEKISPLLPTKIEVGLLVKPPDWRVLRMADPGRFPSEFRANSERIPGKSRANSGQIPSKQPKPSIPQSFCALNVLGWLTTRNTLALGLATGLAIKRTNGRVQTGKPGPRMRVYSFSSPNKATALPFWGTATLVIAYNPQPCRDRLLLCQLLEAPAHPLPLTTSKQISHAGPQC